jgi:fructose 1,6-bisphosphatase
MAWEVFEGCTEWRAAEAVRAGQDLLADAFSGT